jgi:hypothetical protein
VPKTQADTPEMFRFEETRFVTSNVTNAPDETDKPGQQLDVLFDERLNDGLSVSAYCGEYHDDYRERQSVDVKAVDKRSRNEKRDGARYKSYNNPGYESQIVQP